MEIEKKNKAVFLDRDGTINIEKNYLYKIEDFEFIPGAIEGMRLLQENGFLLVIVTNQSGIARGYYKEDDFFVLNSWMMKELDKRGVHISAIYYCPHHPDAIVPEYRKKCLCRKPQIGMFESAIEELNIDLSQSIAIGDKLRDCEIARTTDCTGYLIGTGEPSEIIEEVKMKKYRNIQYADNLLEAAKMILTDSIR